MNRFYYEQDGDGQKNSLTNAHYVIDRYADPFGDQHRTDIPPRSSGATMAREGRKLAVQWNKNPPWSVWDTIQAKRDDYKL